VLLPDASEAASRAHVSVLPDAGDHVLDELGTGSHTVDGIVPETAIRYAFRQTGRHRR
jgi:hypothetical protein